MSENLSIDTRWPTFAPLASEAGILSVLSVCMHLDGDTTRHFGSLNHYASTPNAFDATATDLAVILAAHAAVAIASAELRQDHEGLQTALATRDIIGQAKGILMERGKITGDQAFDILRRGSQLLNRRLRDIAEQIAATGEIPKPPDSGRAGGDVHRAPPSLPNG
jgi:GAF domain-containing protein